MDSRSSLRRGAEFFTSPTQSNHRRYEALRAYFVEGLTHEQAGKRFGYTRWAMVDLVREHRAGRLEFFAPPGKPGPKRGGVPMAAHARGRVIELWLEGLTAKQISTRLAVEDVHLSRTAVAEVLDLAGLKGRRHQAAAPPDSLLPGVSVQDFGGLPARQETSLAGLLLLVPDLVALDLPTLTDRAGYPDTRRIPAVSWLLALLALKLLRRRTPKEADPAPALFAGLTALPRHTALSEYSYWPPTEVRRAFLAAMAATDPGQRAFHLDVRNLGPRRGDPEPDPAPYRQIAIFVSDADTGNLVFAEAGTDPYALVMAFCDHRRHTAGAAPELLVAGGKAAARPILRGLDERGIAFLAPRPGSPGLRTFLTGLTPSDYRRTPLASTGTEVGVHDEPAVALPGFLRPVRQLNLAPRDGDPLVVVTNDHHRDAADLLDVYVRHTAHERQINGLIRIHGTESWSSSVNLNADMDVLLYVLTQNLLSAAGRRFPALAEGGPSAFLALPGELTASDQELTVRLDRQAWSPIHRNAVPPERTIVPWWGGRTLRFQVG